VATPIRALNKLYADCLWYWPDQNIVYPKPTHSPWPQFNFCLPPWHNCIARQHRAEIRGKDLPFAARSTTSPFCASFTGCIPHAYNRNYNWLPTFYRSGGSSSSAPCWLIYGIPGYGNRISNIRVGTVHLLPLYKKQKGCP